MDESGEVFEALGGALDAVGVEAGLLGGLPVVGGVVAGVDCLAGSDAEGGHGGGEGAGVGFIDADLAGDQECVEVPADAEVLEDGVEAAVEVREDGEFVAAMELLEDGDCLRVELPDAGLREVGV